MRVRRLHVRNFRGIQELDWKTDSRLVCFIGAGDSTKTTILDAIEFALSPRWSIMFADSDFFNQDTSASIHIQVTVGDLPDSIKAVNKFGEYLQWIDAQGDLTNDIADSSNAVLTVSLKVDDSLEPVWTVQQGDGGEEKNISSADRERLGIIRVGSFVDRHLSWARGSALNRLTDDVDKIKSTIAIANREACAAVANADLSGLTDAAKKVEEAASELGVKPQEHFRPRMDTRTITDGTTSLTLHDGNIPSRQKGLGTRRLLVTAVQRNDGGANSIMVLDEVEYGLEPHRQKRLVHSLRESSETSGQAIFTTHSPRVLQAIKQNEVFLVRSVKGKTTITSLGEQSPKIYESADVFLGKKVIVCEGKTELGVWTALMEMRTEEPDWLPASYSGVVPLFGNGTPATAQTAIKIAQLGYDVSIFVDSDKPIGIAHDELCRLRIDVFKWKGKVDIETRLSQDLPMAALREAMQIVIDSQGESAVCQRLSSNSSQKINCVADFEMFDEMEYRRIMGVTAVSKKQSWFKTHESAMALGDIVRKYWNEMKGTETHDLFTKMKIWQENDTTN